MQKVMNWINEKLAPPLYKLTSNRDISSIMGGFQKYMPVLLVGAVFQILDNVLPLMFPALDGVFTIPTNLTYGFFAVLLTYTIAHSLAQQLQINPISSGLFSISVFFILQKPVFSEDGSFVLSLDRFGAQGIFVAIVAALFTTEILGLFEKKKWILRSEGLPDFVRDWFAPLIPGFLIVLAAWFVAYKLNFDLQASLATVIAPLLNTSDTFVGFMVTAIVMNVLFLVGINPAITFGIFFPLWFAAIGENAALYAQGLPPVHINMLHTFAAFIVLGGTGATFTLNLLMLGSKSKTLKTLGRTTFIPSIMNINEPLIFGLPIAFNPVLGIPFFINGALVNPVLVYLAMMATNLVNKPINPALIPWIPSVIQGFLLTQDFKAILLILVEYAVNIVVWYPFFKTHEKRMLDKEKAVA
jgi:PTS system cellobiose-specific IIC component